MSAHDNHGNTAAAWAMAGAAMVASVMITVAFFVQDWALAWVGVGVAAAGLVVGVAMGKIAAHRAAEAESHDVG